MKQSRCMSLAETLTNVAVGYGFAILTQMLIFPWFGIKIDAQGHFAIAAIFTAVAVARNYSIRRLFDAIDAWRLGGIPPAWIPRTPPSPIRPIPALGRANNPQCKCRTDGISEPRERGDQRAGQLPA